MSRQVCKHCDHPIERINYALGPQWMHVNPDASFPDTAKGTAWSTCRSSTVATPTTDPTVPSDHTATTEDAAVEIVATHTPELINEGPNGEDDGQHLYCVECGVLPIDGLGLQYGPQHVVEQLLAAGLLATARPDTTTTVEWAVRGQHTGTITPQHSEKHAQAIANALPYYSVVRREVTAWTEAD